MNGNNVFSDPAMQYLAGQEPQPYAKELKSVSQKRVEPFNEANFPATQNVIFIVIIAALLFYEWT